MKALLVEDDKQLSSYLIKGLKEAGFAVSYTANGRLGYEQAHLEYFDVAIVDIMMPEMDGLTLVKELRNEGFTTPVIILSARRSVDDRILGLNSGSDDYLVKPFSFSELLARIQALIRRSYREPSPTTLRVGDLTLDLLSRKVERAGIKIDLPPREFALLEYLMRNANRVVTKTMILERVWEYNFDPQTNVIEVRISRLRDKVDRPFKTKLLHTIRGAGYVIGDR